MESLLRCAFLLPPTEAVWWGNPAVLVEYADSTLVKDLTTKQKIYAQAGILEYWVVNLIAPELIVFREPGNDGYAQETKFSNGLLTALSFPDINIEVRKLFSV
jgi:Uma2 family endonuclease